MLAPKVVLLRSHRQKIDEWLDVEKVNHATAIDIRFGDKALRQSIDERLNVEKVDDAVHINMLTRNRSILMLRASMAPKSRVTFIGRTTTWLELRRFVSQPLLDRCWPDSHARLRLDES